MKYGAGHLLLMAAALVVLGGCRSFYDVRAAMAQGGYGQVLAETRDLERFPQRDRTLILNYRAHAKLGLGYHESARHDFLRAWNIMNLSEGGGVAAAYFFTEDQKWWIGDPYERMFNSWYLGMLYSMDGDIDNAMAAFLNAIFVDTGDVEAGQYAADWLPALLMRMRGFLERGEEDNARIVLDEILRLPREPANFDPDIPWLTMQAQRDANVVMMIELGEGPFFTAEGRYGSVRVINQGRYRESSAEVWINGRPLGRAYKIGDTFFQAITRGGRVMDDILKGKAAAKTAGIVAGAAAMHVGRILVESGGNRETRTAGVVTLAAGAAVLLGGLLMSARADTRGNVLLPGETHLMLAKLPPGDYNAEVRFYDAAGAELQGLRQTGIPVHVPKSGDAVLLLRSRPRYVIPTDDGSRQADPYAGSE